MPLYLLRQALGSLVWCLSPSCSQGVGAAAGTEPELAASAPASRTFVSASQVRFFAQSPPSTGAVAPHMILLCQTRAQRASQAL